MFSSTSIFLACAAILLTSRESVAHERSSWHHAEDRRLERHARDASGTAKLMGAIWSFDFGNIYTLTSDVCKESNPDPESSGLQENVKNWVCDHREDFKTSAVCFQDPFRQKMTECATSSVGNTLAEAVADMRVCVHSVINNLPLCTADSKTFFLEMYDFVSAEQLANHP